MSFTGPAMLISENVNKDIFLQDMNGDALYQYWLALENLFVGKACSEINRSKFAIIVQGRNESIPLYSAKLVALFNAAYPREKDANAHILVIDKFISGLANPNQKKFILQQKNQDDDLAALIDLALKFDSVSTLMTQNPNSEPYGTSRNLNEMHKRGNYKFKGNNHGYSKQYGNYRRQIPKPFNNRPYYKTFKPFNQQGFRNNYYQYNANNRKPNQERRQTYFKTTEHPGKRFPQQGQYRGQQFFKRNKPNYTAKANINSINANEQD